MAGRWDLAFDDPELEREFRLEMAGRHRGPAVWIAVVITILQTIQLGVDLTSGRVWWIATRLGCLAVILPLTVVLATRTTEQLERVFGALGAGIALTFLAYFTITVPTKPLLLVTVDLSGMVMCVLVIGIGLGTTSLMSTRAIAGLAGACAVAFSFAAAFVLEDAGLIFAFASVVAAGAVVGTFTAHALQASRRREYAQARALDRERARSEALLHNVLPAEIAERLKDRPGTIAERFDEATVLFADLVGFTTLAERLAPERLVALLDEVFSEFDEIAEHHGLEKIKTIGDAYMVVGGVPARRDDHVEAVAAMALEMRAAIERRSTPDAPLRVRIGLHTGPVVAGVIGKKKFIYDLWGDTVNTASRMESHGVEGGIQLTTEVRDRLPSRFAVEARGPIAIKGKGQLDVFLLTGCDTRDTSSQR